MTLEEALAAIKDFTDPAGLGLTGLDEISVARLRSGFGVPLPADLVAYLQLAAPASTVRLEASGNPTAADKTRKVPRDFKRGSIL